MTENGHSVSPSNGGGLGLVPAYSHVIERFVTQATVRHAVFVCDTPSISLTSRNSTSPIPPLTATPRISIHPFPRERTAILSAPAVHSSDIDASAFDEPGGSYTPVTMWL